MKIFTKMHDWAAVNTWSRPTTKASNKGLTPIGWSRPSTKISRPSTKVEGLTVNDTYFQPDSGLRRCKTMLERRPIYKPKKQFNESSTLDYIRYLEITNKESEKKLKNTMHVLSIQRSKSDLDVHDTSMMANGGGIFGGGLFRERSQIYLANISDVNRRESIAHGNKQEVKMGVAVVPRKGLISLSTMDDSQQQNFTVQGEKRRTSTSTDGHSAKTKSLIKRKDIIEQIKVGNKLLEDAEAEKHKEEEMTKSLGDYTIMDLQSKILEMTDAKSIKRQTPNLSEMSTPSRKPVASTPKPDKGITLPAIKNLNPFAMKSM